MIEVQGHRGAKGLAPENTLRGFEIALACGVTSIEIDVHLTRDDIPVIIHDPHIAAEGPPVRAMSMQQLRDHRVAGPVHGPTPQADRFAQERGIDPRGIPTLAELFEFAGRFPWKGVFDLELKRIPFHPETINDHYDGTGPALLERLIVAAIRQAGVQGRTRVRSFDHRCVRAIKQLEPALQTAFLNYHTVPADLGALLQGADVYCPDFHFVDAEVVRQVHEAGKRIIPYTVNEPKDWERLIGWGVDGITTDYPDRLLVALGYASR